MKLALQPDDLKAYKEKYPDDFKRSFVNTQDIEGFKTTSTPAKGSGFAGSHATSAVPEKGKYAPDKKHEWVSFKLSRKHSFTQEEKNRYEWFCAGFLYYYDTMLRHDAIDHAMYFKWEAKKVTIYLDPPPLTTPHSISSATPQTDPPKPAGPPPPPFK